MRRIDRYISREVFSHALLGLLIFTFVLFIPQLVRLMELLVRHGGGADAGTVAMLVACALPQVLTFTVPMAVLVGVMIGLGRMSADSEIIALHALGVGLRRILLSVGVVAVSGSIVTLAMTMWAGPAAVRKFREIEQRLRTTQASFEIQPRVFDERFPGVVLYVQDVEAAGTRWRGLLLAGTATSGDGKGERVQRVTLAEEAVVIADRKQGRLQLHLQNGSTHEYAADEPERYAVTTFGRSDLPVTVAAEKTQGQGARARSIAEKSAAELWAMDGPASAGGEGPHQARVELHRRVALPLACVVFALAGVPMGARPRRGGRAAGFVITLLLICGYYLLFITGAGMAQRGAVAPWIGLWAANLVTAAAALLWLPRVEQVQREGLLTRWAETLAGWRGKAAPQKNAQRGSSNGSGAVRSPVAASRSAERLPEQSRRTGGVTRSLGTALGFPLLMDFYLLRSFFSVLVLVLAGFVLLFESFTFFELLNDIAGNSVPARVVAQYFTFLTPHLLYLVLPLAALVAALGTLGVLTKNNEITAFKASGTSLYRLAAPLLFASLLLAAGMFAMDSTFLPYSNQKQDALRNFIKQRPAQTFYQPRGQWIFGQHAKLYNYEYFDADQNRFAGLNVFELDPGTFQMRRRVYAARAHWEPNLGTWVLEEGWVRDLQAGTVSNFVPFPVFTLAELTEPPEYFKREVRPYYQMNWQELRNYIADLQQAGFDVARLNTQWHKKLAFPLLTPIIVLLAVPFAFLVGTRGALGGVAVAMLIAIAYWATAALFEAMGAVGQLPPVMAAWAPDAIFGFVGLYFFLKMPT